MGEDALPGLVSRLSSSCPPPSLSPAIPFLGQTAPSSRQTKVHQQRLSNNRLRTIIQTWFKTYCVYQSATTGDLLSRPPKDNGTLACFIAAADIAISATSLTSAKHTQVKQESQTTTEQ